MREMELGNLLFGNARGEYPVEREPIQEIFWELFEDVLDYHAYLLDGEYDDKRTDRGGYENDTFLINPYYWGEDEDLMEEPNFVYKPEDIRIEWYKYPMRDSWSNAELTEEKAKEIFTICRRSMDG